jgi:dipeptidyl aminopeptidase/acylaminoacyl peptidase
MITFPSLRGALAACTLAILTLLPATVRATGDAALVRAFAQAERPRPLAPHFERGAFLSRPTLAGAWLSPDGKQVAVLRDDGKVRSVWRAPTSGGAPVRVLAQTEATSLSWSRDGRWVFLASPRQLFVVAMAGQPGSRAIGKLGGRWERTFEAVDPALPAAAIVLESPPRASRLAKQWRLFRVDAAGRETLLHVSTKEISDFAIDGRGRLAFVSIVEGEGYTVLRKRGARWVTAVRCTALTRCGLLSASADGSQALLRTDIGSDRLRAAWLGADNRLRTVHEDPRGEADVAEVVLDPATRAPLIANYRSTVAASYAIDPQQRTALANLQAQLPGRNLRIEAGKTAWLVHDRAPTLKGERLFVFDPVRGTSRPFLAGDTYRYRGEVVKQLPESAMARKLAFTYRASDGMPIHGFLLIPPGVDAAHAPLLANVHGGPFAAMRPEFNGVVQLLANRGYVVFEPNFRGSVGYGRTYMRAGKGDFGNGRVQQDIVDGVRWLLANGVGDAQRVGITGVSFGGYSTLQGITFEPDLFKVGIAAVPPADLGWVLRWYSRSVDQMARGIPLATSMRLLDLDPADHDVLERLRVQSPIANAPRVHRPVLLLAGGDDERVPIRSVTHYAAALKALDKDVSLFVDPDARHRLEDPRTREAYLFLMERMLHQRLGGAPPDPPGRALKSYVKKNLLLTGRDFVGVGSR